MDRPHFTREALLAAPGPGFLHRAAVRFQDVDAAGIIFFSRVLEHCHDGYLAFLAAHGCALPQVIKDGAWIAPLAHAEADYLRPLRFGDPLTVALVAARLGEGRVSLGYRVHGAGGDPGELGAVAALAQTVHVFIDPATGRRAPIPAPLAAAFAALGG